MAKKLVKIADLDCFFIVLGVIPHIHKSLIGKKGGPTPGNPKP